MSGKLFMAPLTVVFTFLLATQTTQLSCNNKKKASVPQTTAASNELFSKYNLDKIKLPPGFKISVFAEVPNARSMTWGKKGTLFVGNRSGDKVFAVVDGDKNGVADKVYTIASGLNTPCGVAFADGNLYVAEVNRILRFDDIENRLTNPPSYTVVYDKLPTDKHHGWKFIAFGPDGKLYVPVGAPCNVCEKDNPVYSSITRMNKDGSGFEVFAKGVRNSVGFAWHPQTKELWFTENGRDNMGDNIPADELNIAPAKDMHFGFPYCHQGDTPDPQFGDGKSCTSYTAPALNLGPHVAALGMRFYTGDMFLPEYKNQIFIAEHGSWNRSTPIGYRIMLVRLENGKPVQYIPFATGWLQDDKKVLGRPVDIEIAADGALLVSDDDKGAIYRIIFEK
ncbi:MAG TPA: sorbosone dehydrogenase family protein [Chitinophagaceae bacterium]|nr:sorbosone dehydrogenase family protein [Chitinophagaceae bacterium]